MSRVPLLLAVAWLVAGCDTGGLLVVDRKDPPDAGPPLVGTSAMDFVNGGTVAANAKYRLVYTLGQGTPNQAPAVGAGDRLNGGLIGATETK